MSPFEWLFWSSGLLLAYVYLGYPALVGAWAKVRPSPYRRERIEPTVCVLLVVHDEAERIDARLTNLLALDYPRERIEIVVGSDGSTDDTVERARAYEGRGVRVLAFPLRRGKAAALADLAAGAFGEILVLADARQRFDPGVVRALVAPFADPRVGAVSGELVLEQEPAGGAVGRGVGFYWRYEKFVRRSESRVDSSIGATGAVYAIRRELFEPPPPDTILDDVLVPMRVAARGYRVVFEPGARAYDRAPATSREELARKVRTLAGNLQLFATERWLLNPLRNRLWLQTVSHKGLRLLGPLLLAVLLGSSAALSRSALYASALAAQALFYGGALAGWGLARAGWRRSIFAVPYVFCLLNWAVVTAWFRFAARRQEAAWESARSAAASSNLPSVPRPPRRLRPTGSGR